MPQPKLPLLMAQQACRHLQQLLLLSRLQTATQLPVRVPHCPLLGRTGTPALQRRSPQGNRREVWRMATQEIWQMATALDQPAMEQEEMCQA